jgi:hypothetical protein
LEKLAIEKWKSAIQHFIPPAKGSTWQMTMNIDFFFFETHSSIHLCRSPSYFLNAFVQTKPSQLSPSAMRTFSFSSKSITSTLTRGPSVGDYSKLPKADVVQVIIWTLKRLLQFVTQTLSLVSMPKRARNCRGVGVSFSRMRIQKKIRPHRSVAAVPGLQYPSKKAKFHPKGKR